MNKKSNNLMLGSFGAFFVILFTERVLSLVQCFMDPELGLNVMLFGAKFNKYIYGTSLIFLTAFIVFVAFTLGRVLSLGVDRGYKMLMIATSLLLVPAMLRTEHSIVILQYVSFVFLFIAFLLRFFDIRKERCLNIGYTISSFVYVSLFLFTIPVVKITAAGNTNKPLYYALAFGSIAVVVLYMIMGFKLFSDRYKGAVNPFFLIAAIAVNAAGVVLAIGTSDFPNFFMPSLDYIGPFVGLGAALITYVISLFVSLRLKRRLRKSTN